MARLGSVLDHLPTRDAIGRIPARDLAPELHRVDRAADVLLELYDLRDRSCGRQADLRREVALLRHQLNPHESWLWLWLQDKKRLGLAAAV